jgi:hypothetical protein
MLIIPQVEWDSLTIFGMVGGDIFSFAFLAVLIFIKNDNNKRRDKIILCLEDAIETTAKSVKIGEIRLGFQPKSVKIQVRFKVNGKTYIRESTAKVFGGWEGYLGVYKKYADREICILYSQKYDEVLILKD